MAKGTAQAKKRYAEAFGRFVKVAPGEANPDEVKRSSAESGVGTAIYAYEELGALAVASESYGLAGQWFRLGLRGALELTRFSSQQTATWPHYDRGERPVFGVYVHQVALFQRLTSDDPRAVSWLDRQAEWFQWLMESCDAAWEELKEAKPDPESAGLANGFSSQFLDAFLFAALVAGNQEIIELSLRRVREYREWLSRLTTSPEEASKRGFGGLNELEVYEALLHGDAERFQRALQMPLRSFARSGAEGYKSSCWPKRLALALEFKVRYATFPVGQLVGIPEQFNPEAYFGAIGNGGGGVR